MLVYEYKVDGSKKQYAAIDEAIRIVQFIRNKCLRKWMDERGVSRNDLQTYCAVLADEYPFASYLNSQARQTSADRAWFAISRFYENCKTQNPPDSSEGVSKYRHQIFRNAHSTCAWYIFPQQLA